MRRLMAYVAATGMFFASFVAIVEDSSFSGAFADELPPCDQCHCADVTGFISTRSVMGTYEWYTGRWFYYRNPDGTSGAPIEQSAVDLLHEGGVTNCVDTMTTVYLGDSINEYDVPVPDLDECCVVEVPLTGRTTLLYTADPSPPSGVDPSSWSHTKCQQSG